MSQPSLGNVALISSCCCPDQFPLKFSVEGGRRAEGKSGQILAPDANLPISYGEVGLDFLPN